MTNELSRPDDEWWPLDRAVEWLRDRISEGDWLARNWDCKYIDARIDMRTGAMYLRPGNGAASSVEPKASRQKYQTTPGTIDGPCIHCGKPFAGHHVQDAETYLYMCIAQNRGEKP